MNRDTLLQVLKNNPFLLAPMAGITDSPFRSFMCEMGCGIVTTELISIKSLIRGHPKARELMHFTNIQRPVGVQLFGEDPQDFAVAGQIVEQSGADFIDLNFGCPVTKIIKKGAGSAILKDLPRLKKILKLITQAVSIPVSIKIRTGWDHHSRNAKEVMHITADSGIIWLTIHGRTRAQGFSGTADWDYITQLAKNAPLSIIGNGDLTTCQQALTLKQKSHCQGMMIGRGCLKNPWIFKQVRNIPVKKDYIKILERLKHHLEHFYQQEKMFLLQYKKFCAWFSSGFPNSALFRKSIFQAREKEEVLSLITSYFQKMNNVEKNQLAEYDISLMQGHG